MTELAKISLDQAERNFRAKFTSDYSDVMDYAYDIGRLSYLLSLVYPQTKEMSARQRVSMLFAGKAQRSLRVIMNICSSGYYPEAVPLIRTLFEASEQYQFILSKKGDSRATQWLNAPAISRWDVECTMKDKGELTEMNKKFYSLVSSHTHPHATAFEDYLYEAESKIGFSNGPLSGEGQEKIAADYIGEAARLCLTVTLLARDNFAEISEVTEAYKLLQELPYTKKRNQEMEQYLAANPVMMKDIGEHLGKITKNSKTPKRKPSPAPVVK